MSEPVTRDLAEKITYALGMAMYLKDGALCQHDPGDGELIDPGPKSRPTPHGTLGELREEVK